LENKLGFLEKQKEAIDEEIEKDKKIAYLIYKR